MRQYAQRWNPGHLAMMVGNVRRRQKWFLDGASPQQLGNLALACGEFALRREVMRAWPVLVKVDISPLCNLRCTYCVHARLGDHVPPGLEEQRFGRHQVLPVARFERLAGEIANRTLAVALYYLGDPLMHPQLPALCGVAAEAGLNSHVSTNFSFRLSDSRLHELVTSGLTHLTVCVDGMDQERYERTRVGGDLDLVLTNLDRLLAMRREVASRRPHVEVQFIRFRHNEGDLADAARWCAERGVDQFTHYWGHLHNYADIAPDRYRTIRPRATGVVPRCSWPHFALQLKYDGDAIPCCYHRVSEQYRPGGDARPVGNVFDTSLREVWNSAEYRRLRRLVSRPRRFDSEPALQGSFCEGCPTIFETEIVDRLRSGDGHSWDDLYLRDERGTVRRRPSPAAPSALRYPVARE
jgi:MoaA/NifB/PqqE/SkfB family radical SAM enzyme